MRNFEARLNRLEDKATSKLGAIDPVIIELRRQKARQGLLRYGIQMIPSSVDEFVIEYLKRFGGVHKTEIEFMLANPWNGGGVDDIN
ncbi:MAG: hypothetical protein V3V99_01630 [candidate division Zixibacteria bacterium]